jgi:hypothetical protein
LGMGVHGGSSSDSAVAGGRRKERWKCLELTLPTPA